MKTITAMICATVLGSAWFYFQPHYQFIATECYPWRCDTRTGQVSATGQITHL